MPSVAVRDHQGKSTPYARALAQHGWDVRPIGQPADVFLTDLDVVRGGYRYLIDGYRDAGAKIVMYPHGANVLTIWDGLDEPYPVDLCVTIGEGHKAVMEAYGYPFPVLAAGWALCEQRKFRQTEGRRILFAPTHPLGSGFLSDRDKKANADTFGALLSQGRVTVRHVGTLEQNGLWLDGECKYEHVDMNLCVSDQLVSTLAMIDDADVVVTSPGTFLHLAVARGCPVVAFQQIEPGTDPEGPEETVFPVASWDRYRELMTYPHDLADPLAVQTACMFEAQGWRERFVGQRLNAARLDQALRALLPAGVTA